MTGQDSRRRLAALLAERAGKPRTVPASPAQERLWFLDRLAGDTTAYAIAAALRVEGELDREALRRAFEAVVACHAALRTNFAERDGRPVQVIAPQRPVDLPVVSLRHVPDGDRQAEVGRLFRDLAGRRFDLAADPLLRASLVELGDADHVLLVAVHHIVSDGWSMRLLMSQVTELYQGLAQGRSAPPEPPALQYADHAAWQRTRLTDERLAPHVEYWTGRLAGAPTGLALPGDGARPVTAGSSGGRHEFRLDGEVARGLRELARAEGTTPFAAALTAFQVLLNRYDGRDDVSVGVPVSGRDLPGLEDVVGLFVNTVVIRADLTGHPSFRESLRRVRDAVAEAHAHSELPFERLVERLRPERAGAATPLFQAAFAYDDGGPVPQEVAGARITPLDLDPGTAKFELTMELAEEPDGLRGHLEYRAGLLTEETAARVAGHYQALLASALATPDTPIGDLLILDAAESERLRAASVPDPVPYPRDLRVDALFDDWAARVPGLIAVRYPGRDDLTYAELAGWANRLAHALRDQGIGRGDRVATLLPRGPEMIAAFLAILKAGAAYVPLDLDEAPERRALILRDSGAKLAIAENGTMVEDLPVLTPDDDRLCSRRGTPPVADHVADDAAYVIYTSGSTGRPKGVVVPHRAIIRLVWDPDYIRLTPGDRIAQASNAAFDAATFEIWGALLSGARVSGVDTDTVLDPQALAATIREQRITVLFLTTALFNRIASRSPEVLRPLATLLFGGETADPVLVARALEHGPGRLVHVYGPTETTTFATWHEVTEVAPGATSVPIGGPISNTTCRVVDRELRPLPIGVPGELVIGGDGVALGYLGEPGLTARRFVADPFAPEGRLYRTGDRVRLRADGLLDFLGRFDDQVKLRGFRIEPGEIEGALTESPAVAEAAVVLRQDSPAGPRLVGYLVPAPAASVDLEEVRASARRRLPGYMVPSALVVVDRLPLNRNGKVDHAALPDPVVEGGGDEPANAVEEVLAGLWAQALGVPKVGVHDNFFDLGGHSLLATELLAVIRRVFRMELSMRDLFDALTVADLAKALVDAEPAPGHVERIAALAQKVAGMSQEQTQAMLAGRRS